MPDNYAPLKPVRSPADHLAALAEIDRLFGAVPGTPQADRLEVLAVLVADYERKLDSLPAPSPTEVVTFAMKARGHSQADLARVLGSRSRASEVLSGKRSLSADMAARLAEAWTLPLDLLLAPHLASRASETGAGAKRRVKRAATALLLLLAIAWLGAGGLVWTCARDLPDVETLAAYTHRDVRRYGADGQLLEYRKPVPLSEIPPHVVKAFLAAEDEHYYVHHGYSLWAILRAAAHNIQDYAEGNRLEGGATITQQLAKNLFLAGQQPSLTRKVKEIILARRMEASLSKERILELYLNQIYFGGSAWGIAAAAEHYFGKRPADLGVAEAAYLASLPKAPNAYRLDQPDNRNRAWVRRNWVLARMADDGLITAAAASFAQKEPLGGRPGGPVKPEARERR